MTIRPATCSDAPSLAAISIEVWLSTYLKLGVNDTFARFVLSEFTPDNFAALIEDKQTYLNVADGPDGIEGFVQVSAQCPAPNAISCETEIQKLYVRPSRHRTGLGRELLASALELCSRLGSQSVWVVTNSENTPAVRFYLAHGFAEVGTTHFRLEGQAYPNTIFLRNLHDAAEMRSPTE